MTHSSNGRLCSMRAFAWCVILIGMNGCAASVTTTQVLCECRVIVEGQPAQDVRIVWKSMANDQDGRIEGVTNHAGVASMRHVSGIRLSLDRPIELRASVESLGDWHIVKPWSDIDRSPLLVKWTPGSTRIDIELPKKAVRAL